MSHLLSFLCRPRARVFITGNCLMVTLWTSPPPPLRPCNPTQYSCLPVPPHHSRQKAGIIICSWCFLRLTSVLASDLRSTAYSILGNVSRVLEPLGPMSVVLGLLRTQWEWSGVRSHFQSAQWYRTRSLPCRNVCGSVAISIRFQKRLSIFHSGMCYVLYILSRISNSYSGIPSSHPSLRHAQHIHLRRLSPCASLCVNVCWVPAGGMRN